MQPESQGFTINSDRYGALLARVQPGLIETEEEAERLLHVLEALLDRGDDITPEEDKLAALLTLLIEAYQGGYGDEEGEADEPDAPHEILKSLMYQRGIEVKDLCDVFGNPKVVQEVLDGGRPISKGQSKQLGKLFSVPPRTFAPE